MRQLGIKSALVGSVSILVLAAAPAKAQTANPNAQSDEASSLAEIVVTAQKREQTLIEAPLSVTAISGAQLERRDATALEDLQFSIPGLSLTQFSPGQQRPQIRGVSVYAGLPTVGVYLDELPLNIENSQLGQDVRFLDIKRVEVLRGPQGTLYGQGAMGGSIRYLTNDVDLNDLHVAANGEVGSVDSGGTDWRTDAVVNIPLVKDELGLRLAGSYQRFGGWIDNPVLGVNNVNSGHALTLRGKLAFRLGEDVRVSLMAQHQDLDVGAQNLSDGNQQVFDQVRTPYRSKVDLVNAIVTYDAGFATLLSSTGWIARKDHTVGDVTAALLPLLQAPPPFGFGLPPGFVTGIGVTADPENHIFTQEVRLSSNGDNRLGWTVGGFYRNARTRQDTTSFTTPNALPFTLLSTLGTFPSNSESWAVFGEGTYKIVPTVTALVGLRYFEDRRIQDLTSVTFGAPATDQGRAKFHALSPRFNLSWQPNARLNLYANVAKGFRSGGFNSTSPGVPFGIAIPPTYKPDNIWTYEGGAKFSSEDGRIFGDIAVYYNDWKDVQTTSSVGGVLTYASNGGRLKGWGSDGSLSFRPIAPLTFTVTGGWNDMTYKSTSVEHLPGDRADYVPKFTASASAEYQFHLANLPSYVRVDYQYSDKFQLFLRNFQATPSFSDEQHILNARIGVSGSNWSAGIFARNLLNRDSILYPPAATLIYPARQQPRTIGASLSFNY